MYNKHHIKRSSTTLTKGFLLIEIGIALLFFCGVVSAMFHFYSHAVNWQHEARMHMQATTIANNMLETIAHNGTLPLLQETEQDFFSIDVQSEADNMLPDYNIVRVSIGWQNFAREQRSLTVESGFIIARQE